MRDGQEASLLRLVDGDARGSEASPGHADGGVADPALFRVVLLVTVRAEPLA
eukprot:CAMPEP_0198243398 /NCGR_PEP_ID=MMETSP1446-20131203/27454_1 /TAXON_ID=1461542 ORGANISM="Unidentified sp, Strain CCMP2111" /NCGR_SAMPLE_ID=MMETSP1446 /ASSEMBLY_ACC=CAM_ASM_001112 /LENGTH=51 /DNA_ID=CAMNT_0043927207 /DNA_START=49 /DNA_END=201 /DNA_ORIENTATION=-